MTDKQPEALRLADAFGIPHWTGLPIALHVEAAAELRRLHQSEREAWRYADELEQEHKRLDALNVELVDKLRVVIRGVPDTWDGVKQAKAVLDKAKEKNND